MADSPDMQRWRGRVDPETEALRWHQRIRPLTSDAAPGIVLLGLASDAGVARNQGRVGARRGPDAIRRALANLAWHGDSPIYDAGDVICDDDRDGRAMEAAQAALGQDLASALDADHRPIVLGGGHEVAFASWQGLAGHLSAEDTLPRIGIVNLDAHFDLRDPEHVRSSGTPFAQIADDCAERGWNFAYACLGVARTSNTASLFRRAAELNVLVHEDRDFDSAPETVHADLAAFLDDCDHVYLSFDLDALPAADAPGVSAPAARGVPLARFEPLIDTVRDSGKLRIADIAELNPDFDIDARTARVAARIVHQLSGQS